MFSLTRIIISLPVSPAIVHFTSVLCTSYLSSTTKTGCHDIAEILLKVALNTINQPINSKRTRT
jgi:hypothetical protein